MFRVTLGVLYYRSPSVSVFREIRPMLSRGAFSGYKKEQPLSSFLSHIVPSLEAEWYTLVRSKTVML